MCAPPCCRACTRVPCRDPALPEPVNTRGVRTLTCCAAPRSFHTSTHLHAHAHAHAHARACAHARAHHTYWLGSARPAVAAQAAIVDGGAACARLDYAPSTRCGRVWGTQAAGTCRRRRASASAIVTSARRRSAWTIRVSTVKKRFAQSMKAKLPKLPRSSHGPRFRPTTADESNPKDAAACKPT